MTPTPTSAGDRHAPRGRRQGRGEEGYAAVLVALVFSALLLGLCAIGLDIGRWSVEMERLQKAADAAALAGVTYMPNDMTTARSTAVEVARRNGVTNSAMVNVEQGDRASQLRVTVRAVVPNSFGSALGYGETTVSRSATADYTAPAPMGSPCNTYGNEPRGSTGTSSQGPADSALPASPSSNCPKDATTLTSQPQFWAAVEGPGTDKVQGDRFQGRRCAETGRAGATYRCAASLNTEYRNEGYFFVVNVGQAAIDAGASVDLQVYDPIFTNTGVYCASMPSQSNLVEAMNPFTVDGLRRYGRVRLPTSTSANENTGAGEFCSGDSTPGSNGGNTAAPTTTFVMRGRTDTGNPLDAPVLTTCTPYQFRGQGSAPSAGQLRSNNDAYNPELARVFHQWFSLCSFTPDRAGNYYLQVRSNITFGGSAYSSNQNPRGQTPIQYISKNNSAAASLTPNNVTTGWGANAFSLRAVPSVASARSHVAVSSWERMPVLQLAPDSTATFNLVRALPNARGQYLTFDFYDASDNGTGTITVLPPADASGDVMAPSGVPGCRAGKNDTAPAAYTTLTGCSYAVRSTDTDGQVVNMVIPIPSNYQCDDSTLSGCWFRVQMAYSGNVTDFTTWGANIGGDPVRLIQ